MGHYHLLHCIPHPRMHGLNGYKEVIETVAWGLEQLGHQVTYAINEPASGATNIVFGGQVMPVAALQQLPDGTIIYNFEQMGAATANQAREEIKYHALASNLTVWDYSAANLPAWHALGRRRVGIVPVGYAPILTRIPKIAEQDIDVLIYGMSGERRLQAFHVLSRLGIRTVFVSGLYGAARDHLISRAKIVLNINLYSQTRIFEIVRVSYLLANRKAVIADFDANGVVDRDIKDGVRFVSSLKELTDLCGMLLDKENERVKLEERGFSCMRRRDIAPILKAVL